MTPQEQQRIAFEAFATSRHASLSRFMFDDTDNYPGHYKNYSVQLAWEAWQAAIDHAKETMCKMTELRECCRKHWTQDAQVQQAKAFGVVLMNPLGMPMLCCMICGNKRCPKATDCDLFCSGSNEPGQDGSVYR